MKSLQSSLTSSIKKDLQRIDVFSKRKISKRNDVNQWNSSDEDIPLLLSVAPKQMHAPTNTNDL